MAGPPYGAVPELGSARLVLDSGVGFASGEPRYGVNRLDTSFGLPLSLALRASLPFVCLGSSASAGSPVFAVGWSDAGGTGRIGFASWVELGVVAPSLGPHLLEAHGDSVARKDSTVWVAGGALAEERQTHLSLAFELRRPGRDAMTLGWRTVDSAFSVRAGPVFPSGAQPWEMLFQVAVQPIPDIQLSVFETLPLQAPYSTPTFGLALRWDFRLVRPKGDIRELRQTHRASLADMAVPGKVTVFELGAAWCGGCKIAKAELEERARTQPDLAVRMIDVDERDDLLRADGNKAGGVPVFVVFDRKRRRVGRVTGSSNMRALYALIARARLAR